MKTILCIVVYNRFNNLKQWIDCWEKSIPVDAEMVVIHNYYGDNGLREQFSNYCAAHSIRYVPRNGQGFDIGCMQDVFGERLVGFPNDWNMLLWCCDDTFPMQKDFIQPYIDRMRVFGVGIAAMQISKSVDPHVRTTGFAISKQMSKQIRFPVDPVTTKGHCYHFEHRGARATFTSQVRAMGFDCVQVAPIRSSPLWDSAHPNAKLRIDRQVEFNEVWGLRPPNNKVVFIVPIYDAFPEIISALMCQSHKNWELLLIDDNPNETICRPIVNAINDERIKYIKRDRVGNFGHPHRQWALTNLDTLSDAEFVCITNGDNYYSPGFIKYMMEGFTNSPSSKAVFCDQMVHNYIKWGILQCSLKVGFIDCGGVIVRRDVATEIGWRDVESHSSDFTYFSDIISRYGVGSFYKIKGCFFVHN